MYLSDDELFLVAGSFTGAIIGVVLSYLIPWPKNLPSDAWMRMFRERPVSYCLTMYAFAYLGISIGRTTLVLLGRYSAANHSLLYEYLLALAFSVPAAVAYWIRLRRETGARADPVA
jgi:hypothetical protein